MNDLQRYIAEHTERGECQCGNCADKMPDRAPTGHSVDLQFFWVSAVNNPKAEELSALLVTHYPHLDRLKDGPSYIEIGAELGDQGLALLLIGLGELVGLWKAITPRVLGFEGEMASQMAGNGMVMMSGFKPTEAVPC